MQTIYSVKVFDYRFPKLDELVSMFTTTDFEVAQNEFTKIRKSEKGTPIEVQYNGCGDFTKSFWIGDTYDFLVVFSSDC